MKPITASRGPAVELEDGCLEVTLKIHKQCKADFMLISPTTNEWVELLSFEKPATQGTKPATLEPPTFKPPSDWNNTAEIIAGMSRHPYFQKFVADQSDFVGGADAVLDTRNYAIKHSRLPNGMTDPEQLKTLHARYVDWCLSKGLKPNG